MRRPPIDTRDSRSYHFSWTTTRRPSYVKWRIDEARKHAFQTRPALAIDPPRITRCRLNAVKVDHFHDFLSSPSFLQDVAYGTRTLKLESGQSLEIPNMVRTVISSHLVRIYLNFCAVSNIEPLRPSTLFNAIKVWIIDVCKWQTLIRVNGSGGVTVVILVWNQSIFVSVQLIKAIVSWSW